MAKLLIIPALNDEQFAVPVDKIDNIRHVGEAHSAKLQAERGPEWKDIRTYIETPQSGFFSTLTFEQATAKYEAAFL